MTQNPVLPLRSFVLSERSSNQGGGGEADFIGEEAKMLSKANVNKFKI